ncbi:uncharacterized protein LOC131607327 [Vicia villosa]|uniref:uncharacterized protein LOC131607327 n=1 Tax=Vicia villosa TaxID=3911 RepID=UPI00273B1433|nr:uncharacterized protein LOC131607327 [Vicia villosa]
MASTGSNDFLAGAKGAAATAQKTIGEQASNVATAAGGVQKTVGEYVGKAVDYVNPKPEPKPVGVVAGATKAAGDLFKK